MEKMKRKPGIKLLIFSLTIILVVLIDRLTKLFFVNNYALGESVPVIKNILHFTYVHNYGAGFSLLQNQTLLFIVFAVLVICEEIDR